MADLSLHLSGRDAAYINLIARAIETKTERERATRKRKLIICARPRDKSRRLRRGQFVIHLSPARIADAERETRDRVRSQKAINSPQGCNLTHSDGD
jgi:hypothetical protein